MSLASVAPVLSLTAGNHSKMMAPLASDSGKSSHLEKHTVQAFLDQKALVERYGRVRGIKTINQFEGIVMVPSSVSIRRTSQSELQHVIWHDVSEMKLLLNSRLVGRGSARLQPVNEEAQATPPPDQSGLWGHYPHREMVSGRALSPQGLMGGGVGGAGGALGPGAPFPCLSDPTVRVLTTP